MISYVSYKDAKSTPTPAITGAAKPATPATITNGKPATPADTATPESKATQTPAPAKVT